MTPSAPKHSFLHIAAANNYPYLTLMHKGGYVYLVTNTHHNVIYVGMTSQLLSRIYQHKTHFYKRSFSDRYNIEHLVYYESFNCIEDAIAREKQVKKWRKEKKIALISSMNPEWKDLYDEMNG